MPAKSRAQQIVMAIAEHEPSKLESKNRGVLKMSQQQLHDFAATPRKGLPAKVRTDSHPGLKYQNQVKGRTDSHPGLKYR